MNELVENVMAAVGDDIVIVLVVVFVAAIADTALGIGVILPGELAIVLASVVVVRRRRAAAETAP